MKLRNFIYLFLIVFTIPVSANAVGMAGTNYEIPFDSINIGGSDFASSPNYFLSDTLGENATDFSSSGSYAMNFAGYRQPEVTTLTLVLSTNNLTLASIQVNSDTSRPLTTTVTTNAGNGYDLFIKENQTLTSGINTIPDFGGTIAVPIPWVGNGFGITLTSGTGLDPKWGAGTNYAGIPLASTLVHPKAGYSAAPDDTLFSFYVNVGGAQALGTYTNIVTFTALPKL